MNLLRYVFLPLDAPLLIAFFKNNGKIVATCRDAKVTRATWYNWRNSDPVFQRSLREMVQFRRDELEGVAHDIAFRGDVELIKVLLKAYDRALFDDAYAKQERAFEKGTQPFGTVATPIHIELVWGRGPEETEGGE